MPSLSQNEPGARSGLPCLAVLISLGLFSFIHFAIFFGNGALWSWKDGALDHAFREAGTAVVRNPVQLLRTTMGLDANDVVEHDGQLYYRPDIEHVHGRSFLEPPARKSHVVLRQLPSTKRTRNPVPAIVAFDRQLKQAGIRLVLLPVPSKAVFADSSQPPILNKGYLEFVETLHRDHKVEVLDLIPLLGKLRAQGGQLFLEGDSHWTPEAMLHIAHLVARATSVQPPGDPYQTVKRTLSAPGNLTRRLGRNRKETIASSMVLDHNEEIWKPSREAPYLLLGDSFSNIYSLGEMGWGKGAGFAEMLSLVMSAPVDRITRNADGAFASREDLLRDPDRLARKSVVVWQFAMRELSFGNWKVLDLPRAGLTPRPHIETALQKLEGTIARVANVPPLVRTPYRQAVREVLLENVRSESGRIPERILLLGYGVQDHLLTGVANWEPGDQVSVQVVPWETVESSHGRLHRFVLEDPGQELLEMPRFWMK